MGSQDVNGPKRSASGTLLRPSQYPTIPVPRSETEDRALLRTYRQNRLRLAELAEELRALGVEPDQG